MSNNGTFATQRSSPVRTERPALRARDLVITPPTLSASVNNYCPAGIDTCEVIRLSSSTSVNITGIKAIADGRPRLLWNVGSSAIVLMNGSSSSVVGNRLATVSDVTLVANSASVIQYDLASKVWRVIGQELAGTGTSGQVLTSNGAGTLPTFQTGGISGFTSSQNTSSPNDTVNASRLLADGGTTHVDFVAQPKGSGAVLAQLPDSTATGGNKRGANSVDFQTIRTSASQSATGIAAFIGAGKDNTASSSYSSVIGGRSNTASLTYSSVIGGRGNTSSGSASISGGRGNTASGTNTICVGGYGNSATATHSAVICGKYNAASGQFSSICGGLYATARGLYGMSARASGRFGTTGDAQGATYYLRGLTTDATAKVLTADQGAASATNQCILPNNSSYTFFGKVSSHRTDAIGTSAGWIFQGVIRRGANAAATTLVSSSVAEVGKDSGALTWTIALSADTTDGGLAITFTGEASKTIRTVCVIESCEVTS